MTKVTKCHAMRALGDLLRPGVLASLLLRTTCVMFAVAALVRL